MSYFDNAASFTYTGTGGSGAGSFTIGVSGTSPFNLTLPSPNSSLNINSGQNLILSWENNNHGAGEVTATLAGLNLDFENPENSKVYSINCRFVDDGEGVIPANLLAQLNQAVPSDGIQFDIPMDLPIDIPGLGSNITLNVDRTNYQLFNTGAPSLTSGIAAVSSGAALFGKFQ